MALFMCRHAKKITTALSASNISIQRINIWSFSNSQRKINPLRFGQYLQNSKSESLFVCGRSLHLTTAFFVIVKVPAFADSVAEGDVKFTCKVGDSVAMDENVMEIETDKTAVPVPSPKAGKIVKIFVKDGDTVKPGENLYEVE